MNICFPSLSYRHNGKATSGVGSQVCSLAHALIDAGHSVSVIDLAGDKPALVTDHGVEVYRETAGRLHWFLGKLPLVGNTLALPLREIEYSIAVWRGVRKANRSRRIDLIEGTETGMLLLALLWKKTPLIIRLHGEQYTFQKYTPGMRLKASVRLSRRLQRFALRRAKLLISPSFAHAREIRDELDGPIPPIVVVPNVLGNAKTNGHGNTPTSSRTVLYAGRIDQSKGIKTLLRAAAQTRDALPDARFIFAGDFHSSVSPDEFQSWVRTHNLDDNVDLLGPLGWNILSELYKSATVAVLPSHYETFGMAALEPMASGTPVVASDSSALPEIVIHEKNGKLFAPGDCGALARALIEVLSQPAARERMSKAAAEQASRFDVNKLLPVNERLYEWCINENFGAAGVHVFFSPHLDDAVLSCGGAIGSLASENRDVHVVTVFAGEANDGLSAFARHLHAKWGVKTGATCQRREEDNNALLALGVAKFEHWDFAEAAYRRGVDGQVLYAAYDDLRGRIAPDDQHLIDLLQQRVLELNSSSPDAVLYFPLSLGEHIDHRILYEVGRKLSAHGLRVRFYEDLPYAENFDRDTRRMNWLSRTVSIDLGSKLKAASLYGTQVRGLGGSKSNLEKRLKAFGSEHKRESHTECYWEPVLPLSIPNSELNAPVPLRRCQVSPRFADFKNLLLTFRWHDLDEMLPTGDGDCIDLGCGNGRHKSLIESKGYEWIGLDRSHWPARVKCDVAAIPLVSRSQAAVIAWQVLEYSDRPEQVLAEAARVLEEGGVFCGSVLFLEPVHGRTYYNVSPLILEKVLRQNGFADIEIKPGLNGFALMLWTWLGRLGVPGAQLLAIPAAFLTIVPLAALLFCLSWLSRLMGIGTGNLMHWLSRVAPLEIAGHIMFRARKKANIQNCTSLS